MLTGETMKRIQSLATGLLFAAALLMQGCGKEEPPKPAPKAEAPPPAETIVKIGVASPLTGPQAHIGIDIKNGVQLAVDDANAAGVTIDGKKIKLQLIAESRCRRRPLQLGRVHPRVQDLFRRRHSADLAVLDQSEIHAAGIQDHFPRRRQ